MMSAGKRVSVSLGILLLIGSVIGILVILGRSGLESSSSSSSSSGAASKTLNLERHRYHHKHGLQPQHELQPGGDGYRTYRPGRINGVANPRTTTTTTGTTTTTTFATPAETNEAEVNGNEQGRKKKVLQRLEERVNSKRNEKVINEMEKGRIDEGGAAAGVVGSGIEDGAVKRQRPGPDLEARPVHPVGSREEMAASSVNDFRNTPPQDSFGGESVKNVHETYSQMNWNKFMPSSPAPPPPATHRKPSQVSSTDDKWLTHPATRDHVTSTGLQHDVNQVYNSASGDLMAEESDHRHEMYGEEMLDEDGYEEGEEDQEDEYLMDGDEMEEDEVEQRWAESVPLMPAQPSSLPALAQRTLDLNKLLEMAKEIYNLGNNQSNLNELWRVVNETVRKSSNESSILSHLNVVYNEPSAGMSIKVDGTQGLNKLGGRNKVEKSLSAFAFMSFGIFLLNQIHKLMGKEASSAGREGRGMGAESPVVESSLNILFQPPDFSNGSLESFESSSTPKPPSQPDYHISENATSEADAQGRKLHSPQDDAGGSVNWVEAAIPTSGSTNDMFRGVLNLMNAYTKDGKVLECIWSLYCHDLDNTAAQQGLYGLAARINSIGLRLIMEQIPAELTLDVLLRSLLGWDGLPCRRMFPKCLPQDAVKALKASSVQWPSGLNQHLSS